MTSVQQVNYHPGFKRYLLPNWAWVSMDGNPKPQLGIGGHVGGPGHMRSQLTLFEAPAPWGPWRLFHRDDNWSYPDGSTGAYTPIMPPAWVSDDEVTLVSTQCCDTEIEGYKLDPTNNYAFVMQRITGFASGQAAAEDK